MSSVKVLLEAYNKGLASEADAQIVEFLLMHLREIGSIGVGDVAQAVFVSKATVSRCIRKLGFESWDEFVAATDRYRHTDRNLYARMSYDDAALIASDPAQFFNSLIDDVCSSIEELKQSVDLEEVDSLINCMLNRPAAILAFHQPLELAHELQSNFLMKGVLVRVPQNALQEQQVVKEMTEGSVVLVLSCYGNYIDDHVALFSQLRAQGCRLFLVTLCYSGYNMPLFDQVIRLSAKAYSSVGILPMKVFVEYVGRRMLSLS